MVNAIDWIKRAKSNLAIAKNIYEQELEAFGGEIFFEELCFEIQQSVEKAFKALLLFHNIEFPKTHDIDRLIKILRINNIEVPEEMLDAGMLTQYAVRTRYPDDIRKITQEEYIEALNIAEIVYNWAKEQIEQ
ncbi:MAG: HEPN domain-containing protein [bacterium]